MAIFKYRAKKGPADVVQGNIEAETSDEAVDKLSQMGYHPLSVSKGSLPDKEDKRAVVIRGKVKSGDVTVFTRQLASLLKSGVSILSALNIISDQSENQILTDILRRVHNAIKEGSTFSSVLGEYPKVFSSLYVAMVRTGESSGSLPESLYRIADHRAKQEEMFSRFRMALAYPVLMALVGLGTVIFMLTFVMPRLMGIFANMGQDLPVPTKILIYISGGLRDSWFWIVLILSLVFLILMRTLRTDAGRLSVSAFKLHLPVFGIFMLKAELARFCRTLELLLKNGVPILKAMNIAIPVLENDIIKNKLKEGSKDLEQGGSLGKSLKGASLFPVFMSNLIVVGEESGRLEEALSEVAASYERDTDEAIRIMSSLLEPVMILVMGLIVGFIVVAMLLPIFEINVMTR